MAHDEDAEKHTERDRGPAEEVHCGDGVSMVAQKGKPELVWLGIPECPAHPAGNCLLRDIKTKHKEFPKYPRRSPGRVLNDHAKDQCPHFFRRRPSPGARPDFRDQPPVQTITSSVPADYSFERDDDKGLVPSRPDPPRDYPKEFIEDAEARARMSTLQHDELMALCQIFKEETSACVKDMDQRSEAKSDEAKDGQEL